MLMITFPTWKGGHDFPSLSALPRSHKTCLGPGHGWPWIGVRSCPVVVPGLLLGAQKACGVGKAEGCAGQPVARPSPRQGSQCFLPGQARNGAELWA